MKKYFLLFYILSLTVTVSIIHIYVYAAENTFQTSLSIVPDDNFPPTIPSGLIATPYSSTQIDLDWTASTDDVAVAGYRVFRDGLPVGTTTAVFYSDTGLLASTTYSYTVEAFDAVLHYSGQSSSVSTTTLAQPIVLINPATTTGQLVSSTGSIILKISNLIVESSQNSSLINFSTNQSAQVKLYWGITKDYELGSISGLFYDFDHSIKIDGLELNTNYFFKIEATNNFGRTAVLESTFQTQKNIEESKLTNVSNFRAIPNEDSIALTWNNPQSINFDSVRIIRSDKFFPRDIYDGQIIYEGNNESYNDTDLEKGKTYYYSIFARDTDGLYSSGVLAKARIAIAGEISISPTSTDPFIGIDILKNVDPMIAKLLVADFDFFQSNRKLLNVGNVVVIDGTKNLTISLDYNKVPEILKTIAFTLIDPEDSSKVFPFLLRINKEKTAYEATLAPLGKSGKYEMRIIVLDYKNQGLKRLEGSLKALVFSQAEKYIESRGMSLRNYILIFIIILILIIFFILKRKDKKNEEK